jgi:hypothetical protein
MKALKNSRNNTTQKSPIDKILKIRSHSVFLGTWYDPGRVEALIFLYLPWCFAQGFVFKAALMESRLEGGGQTIMACKFPFRCRSEFGQKQLKGQTKTSDMFYN